MKYTQREESVVKKAENSEMGSAERAVAFGVPTSLASYLSWRAGKELAGDIASRTVRHISPFDFRDYKNLKREMGITEKVPMYHSDTGLFVSGEQDPDFLKHPLRDKYTEQARKNIAAQKGPRIFVRKNDPLLAAHELGHARFMLDNPRLSRAVDILGKITSKAALPAGILMAAAGEEDSPVVKAAPFVAAAAGAPGLFEEAEASWRGLSALKRLGKYSPEELRRMSLRALRNLGIYSLPTFAAAIPVGVLSLIRSRSSSEKKDDGAQEQGQAS